MNEQGCISRLIGGSGPEKWYLRPAGPLVDHVRVGEVGPRPTLTNMVPQSRGLDDVCPTCLQHETCAAMQLRMVCPLFLTRREPGWAIWHLGERKPMQSHLGERGSEH